MQRCYCAPVVRRTALLLALLGMGCGDFATPTPDAGPRRDTGAPRDLPRTDAPSPVQDRDGDGLCDATEAQRRTDPTLADSDYDGLSDAFEVRIGSDPQSGRSPSSRDRMQLEERAGSVWPVPWFVEYQGMGESLLVAILDRAGGIDGRLVTEVADFAIEGIGGDPAAFVGGVDGARILSVTGPTRLEWRITASWREGEAPDGGAPRALGCRRAYEAIAIVKQDGGDTVAGRRLILDVIPPPVAMDAGVAVRWRDGVTDDGFCRASACF